jgi:hypothetical protein
VSVLNAAKATYLFCSSEAVELTLGSRSCDDAEGSDEDRENGSELHFE